MAYEPTVWAAGDSITSEKLNKLENAVANGSGSGSGGNFLVAISMDYSGEEPIFSADKTFAEISEAIEGGAVIFARLEMEAPIYLPLLGYVQNEEMIFGMVTTDPQGAITVSVEIFADDLVTFSMHPASGGNFLVTININDSGAEPVYIADKTFNEIESAIELGMSIRAVVPLEDTDIYLPLVSYVPGDAITFGITMVDGYYIQSAVLSIFSDDHCTFMMLENPIDGGSDELVVTFTADNNTWTADKTFAEVYQAMRNGAHVRGIWVYKSGSSDDAFEYSAMYSTASKIYFIALFAPDTAHAPLQFLQLTLKSDDTVEYASKTIAFGY